MDNVDRQTYRQMDGVRVGQGEGRKMGKKRKKQPRDLFP